MEKACDELVIENAGAPLKYARTLTSMAESIKGRTPALEYAAGFVFSRCVFMRRIEAILSMRNHPIAKLSGSAGMVLIILMCSLTMGVIAFPVTSRAVDWSADTSTEYELEKMMNRATTTEKWEAIKRINEQLRIYRRHTLAAVWCSKLILTTDRNVGVIGKLAEYGLSNGSDTLTYILIARYAAKAKIADVEFLDLAELVKTYGTGSSTMVKLARQASKAGNEAKLEKVRQNIRAMDRRLAAKYPKKMNRKIEEMLYDTSEVTVLQSLPTMTIDEVEKKAKQAETTEKREAIERIQSLLKKYNRHYSATQCVDMILEADRNVEIIGKIAEYAIKTGYHTTAFIQVAEYAAAAPVADEEFIVLANRVKKPWGSSKAVKLAKQSFS